MAIPRIWVVFHSFGHCPTQFVVDIAKTLRYTGTMIPAVIHEPSCYVDTARNRLVRKFLAEKDATHMMMVDVDLSFESDAILKSFTILSAYRADILYGNYPLGSGANSIFGPPVNKAQESAVRVKLEANKVYTDIATGGTGWLLCTREILERMQKECPGPWHWFARDKTTDGTDLRGEDISFGLRAWGLDPKPKIIGTTAILLKHIKQQGFFADFMGPVAVASGNPGICIPNPYESDTQKYAILGNDAVDLESLTPDGRAQVLAEVAKLKEAEHAGSAGTGLKEQSPQEGPQGEKPQSVYLRDPAQDGVETGEGKGTN